MTQCVTHPVQAIGESHGFYGNYIGVGYVFDRSLDTDVLQRAVDHLISELPHLNSRYDRRNNQVIISAEPLKIDIGFAAGIVGDYSRFGTDLKHRADFIDEPSRKAVQSGRAPMMTVRCARFDHGGCILGIAIHHILVDAAGFHKIARRLADIYTAFHSGVDMPEPYLLPQLEVFDFGTDRTRAQTLSTLKSESLPVPVKIEGPIGGLFRNIIRHAMDRMAGNKRIIVSLSAEDVRRLKDAVLKESGETWISTNAALSAHFLRIMARLMFGRAPRKQVQIGQLIDLRGRFFKEHSEQQDQFTSNAILIHTESAEFESGIQDTSRGPLARFFKQSIEKIDGEFLRARLDLITDTLRHGYSYVGLELKNPMIALNNQSKMPVYNLAFSGQTPSRIIPQDVGDNIMFFPIPDGGIEVYIRDIMNPARQEKLLELEWQKEIYNF